MKKLGAKPHVLFALGSLSLALTSCRESNDAPRYIAPEGAAGHLAERGYRPGEAAGSYIGPDGLPLSEEEALRRTGRTTIRRGFGRFGISLGLGGGS